MGICEDCAKRYGVLEEAKKQGLPMVRAHPNPKDYRKRGFEVKSCLPIACSCCETWDDVNEPLI
jgi:hypothetical protein